MGVLHVAGGPWSILSVECLSSTTIFEFVWSKAIGHYATTKDLNHTLWMEQISSQLSSTRSVLRACVGWVFELGISSDMAFYDKKNLALINAAAFVSLLSALPGTFVLIFDGIRTPIQLAHQWHLGGLSRPGIEWR